MKTMNATDGRTHRYLDINSKLYRLQTSCFIHGGARKSASANADDFPHKESGSAEAEFFGYIQKTLLFKRLSPMSHLDGKELSDRDGGRGQGRSLIFRHSL